MQDFPRRVENGFLTYRNSLPFRIAPMTLKREPRGASRPRLMNVANFAHNNAGDRVLPVAVRDSIAPVGPARWSVRHAHRIVDAAAVRRINASAGLVIGGGGLFLKDTNPNNLSGWQWSCSLDALNQITTPIAVYAVGYNRFRGQEDFDPLFTEHLTRLVEKSSFFGLRNTGSIEAIRGYLPEGLRERVVYQPCPTTVLSRLYPELTTHTGEQWSVALNCAFDREGLRFGPDGEKILADIARGLAVLGRDFPIRYYSHVDTDDRMLPYLDRAGVKYRHYLLQEMSPEEIIRLYSEPVLTIGMRGHSQMVPLGCGRPIVSLASHEKLWYFLQDIGAPEWGVDVKTESVGDVLVDRVRGQLDAVSEVGQRLRQIQDDLYATTLRNVHTIRTAFGLVPAGAASHA